MVILINLSDNWNIKYLENWRKEVKKVKLQAVPVTPTPTGEMPVTKKTGPQEPVDFLNILAALLMPVPQTLPGEGTDSSNVAVEGMTAGALVGQIAGNMPETQAENQAAAIADIQVDPQNQELLFPTLELPQQEVPAQDNEAVSESPAQTLSGESLALSSLSELAAESAGQGSELESPVAREESDAAEEQLAGLPAAESVKLFSRQGNNGLASQDEVGGDSPVSPEVAVNPLANLRQTALKAGQDSEAGNDAQLSPEPEFEAEVSLNKADNKAADFKSGTFATNLARELGEAGKPDMVPADRQIPAQELREKLPRLIGFEIRQSAGNSLNKEVVVQLEPKDLGKLLIKLTEQDGVIKVKIFTEHAESRQLIESGLANLRQALAEQGIKYGQMDVELGGEYLQQEYFNQQQQHQHPQQQQPQFQVPGFRRYLDGSWQETAYRQEDLYTNPVVSRGLSESGTVDYVV